MNDFDKDSNIFFIDEILRNFFNSFNAQSMQLDIH